LGGRDAIRLPQRLRLLCTAKRIERVGSDAGAALGPGVVSSQCLRLSSSMKKSMAFYSTPTEILYGSAKRGSWPSGGHGRWLPRSVALAPGP